MDKTQLDELLRTVAAMKEAEEAVADFYLACAERWRTEAAFFLARAEEEDSHVQALSAAARIIADRPWSFFLGRRLEREAVLAFTAFARRQAALVREKALDLAGALGEAKALEESVLESRFEDLVRGSDAELTPLLELLRDQTRTHRDLLAKKLEEMRGKGKVP